MASAPVPRPSGRSARLGINAADSPRLTVHKRAPAIFIECEICRIRTRQGEGCAWRRRGAIHFASPDNQQPHPTHPSAARCASMIPKLGSPTRASIPSAPPPDWPHQTCWTIVDRPIFDAAPNISQALSNHLASPLVEQRAVLPHGKTIHI